MSLSVFLKYPPAPEQLLCFSFIITWIIISQVTGISLLEINVWIYGLLKQIFLLMIGPIVLLLIMIIEPLLRNSFEIKRDNVVSVNYAQYSCLFMSFIVSFYLSSLLKKNFNVLWNFLDILICGTFISIISIFLYRFYNISISEKYKTLSLKNKAINSILF